MMVKIPDQLYLRSISRLISTENMNGAMIAHALVLIFDTRLRKCKTVGAKIRLLKCLEQGNWWAKRATFAEKLNETEAELLVDMLTTEQKQAIIDVLMKRGY